MGRLWVRAATKVFFATALALPVPSDSTTLSSTSFLARIWSRGWSDDFNGTAIRATSSSLSMDRERLHGPPIETNNSEGLTSLPVLSGQHSPWDRWPGPKKAGTKQKGAGAKAALRKKSKVPPAPPTVTPPPTSVHEVVQNEPPNQADTSPGIANVTLRSNTSRGTVNATLKPNNSRRIVKVTLKANNISREIADVPLKSNHSRGIANVTLQDVKSGKSGRGVVYFLFLIKDSLPHTDIWQAFFADADPGTFEVLLHCSDPVGCAKNGVPASVHSSAKMVATTPTWYCHDLVSAMKQLLVGAMAIYPRDRFPAVIDNEKFVFLSESTLPAKPFSSVYSALLSDYSSDFCIFPSDQWASAEIDSRPVMMVKHHQWVVLNRRHAEIFSATWKPVDNRGVWHVWLKEGYWIGKQRFVSPQHFVHPHHANWCTDEWAFFATIFGAIEPQGGVRGLGGFGGGVLYTKGSASLVSQGRCRTFSYWDTYDHAGAQLGAVIQSDSSSRISCYPRCVERPAELQSMSDFSLRALRASPFLFARKFAPNIWMPHFQRIVLQ